MELFAAFLIFSLVMLGMSLGVIFSGRTIKGSCGGLGNLRDERGRPLCECGSSSGSLCERDSRITFLHDPSAPELAGTRYTAGNSRRSPSPASAASTPSPRSLRSTRTSGQTSPGKPCSAPSSWGTLNTS